MEFITPSSATREFSAALARSLSACVAEKLGAGWQVRLMEEERSSRPSARTFRFRIKADGGLEGDCNVAMDREEAIALAAKLLGESPSDVETKYFDALIQMISSATPELSATFLNQFGSVTFTVDGNPEVVGEKCPTDVLEVSDGDESQFSLQLEFSGALVNSLSGPTTVTSSTTANKSGIDPSNLQLVMDVELNVSLRFGQCQLPLREVLDLASGSVIELDRDVDDPVELLLDGKVIARGEAVIVDGNYGLRVTEIPEPISTYLGG